VEVGVDVEEHRAAVDVEGLAPRLCAPPELEALRALAPAARRVAFFELWTRKEALLKAVGCGLGLPLPEVELAFPLGPGRRQVALTPPDGPRHLLEVAGVEVGQGSSAAVALQGSLARLALYRGAG
jgi:4'-phosphopantetheinyl transferase